MNLKKVNHINELRKLGLPLNRMLIVGSGTLALFGIRSNKDIDLWVTNDVFKKMSRHKDLVPVRKNGRLFYETKNGHIEASNSMPCTKESLEKYLKRAIIVDGIYFKSVNDLINWKKCMGRSKDLNDIKMLEKYSKKDVIENYLERLNG
jgi:hypothetical protein